MNFSEVLSNITSPLFSPDSQFLSISTGTKITIKTLPNLENIQVFSFPDQVSLISFSPDSKLILAVIPKKSLLEARSILEEDWLCKAEDPLSGLIYARWAPDSRHILAFSDFQLKLSIYSLADKAVYYIKGPKYPDKGVSFSSDGKFMALAERRDTKDYIGVYYCGNWKLVNHFPTDTYDLSDIMWSPDNNVIIAWETLLEYKLLVYCPATGILAKFQPYQSALGIKTVNFSNKADFLAIGSFDEKARILNCLTWKLIIEFEHPSAINDQNISFFKEEEQLSETAYKNPMKSSQYVMKDPNIIFKIPTIKVPNDKPNPQMGVGLMGWSFDGQFLATRNDNMPNTVWIWEMQTLSLKVILQHLQQIKYFSWSPTTNDLAICTGIGKIYFWSNEGASICDVPFEGRNFNVWTLDWSKNGSFLILSDKNDCLVVYPKGNREEDYIENNDIWGKKMKSVNRVNDKY